MAIRVDEKKCIGCRICEMTCSLVNFNEASSKKSAIKSNESHKTIGTFNVVYCNQCGICAMNCPVDAIKKDGKNWWIDPDDCINCGVCKEVCPRDAIFESADLSYPIKCCGCDECAKVCPVKAITKIED